MNKGKQISEIVGMPYESIIVKHQRSEKSRRIERIVLACRYASEEDIKIIERVLRIDGNI